MDDPFIILDEDKTIKKKQVGDYHDHRGYDGGFLFGLGESGSSLSILVNQRRIFWFSMVILFCIAILFFRTMYLQFYQGSYYRNIAEGNRIRIQPVRSSRGVIWDRNGKLLVRNVPRFSLFFVPADLPKDELELNRVLSVVAETLDRPVVDLKKMVDGAWEFSYEPVLVEEDVPYEKAILLEIGSADLGGIFMETVARREYLRTGEGLAHIMGYTSKLSEEDYKELGSNGYLLNDYIGRNGIERVYEEELRGIYGKKKVEVDFLGKEENVLSTAEPVRGKDLILAIDFDLQKKASEVFKNTAKEYGATKGVVIIMDVNSGAVLTFLSLPDYDNNLFSLGVSDSDYQALITDEEKPLFNRAIAGEYPPGSTFKLPELVGALEDGIVAADTHVFSTGGIRIGEWFFPDWKAGGHGRVTATKAIAESVNTYFYYIGGGYEDFEGLGVERINHWAYLFGVGQELGIDLLGEEDGFLPSKQWKLKYKEEPWYIGDTYHLAIGQGDVLVTPLQVASYTMAIANGGKLYKPHLVLGLKDTNDEGSGIEYLRPEIVRENFCSKENLNIIREGMRDGVVYGSSRGMSWLSVDVAGKTGTAQVGGDLDPHAWWTGFAPYEEPEIAITVLVENGAGDVQVAIPIAREILRYYFERNE